MKTNSVIIIDPVGKKAGMDYYDVNLANALNAKGINTFIGSNFSSESGKSLKFFNSERKRFMFGKLVDFLWGFIKSLWFAQRKDIKYAIVHIFSTELKDYLAILMIRAAGLKVVSIAHDISGFANTDSSWIKNKIFNKHSDLILVHNKYSYVKISPIVKKDVFKKIHVIPHGSYVNQVNKEVTKEFARKALNIPQNKKIILFFGQIKKVKGLDILLNSLPEVNKDIHAIIAGKPWKDNFQVYSDLIEKNNLVNRVVVHKRFIEDEERELFLKAADLLVIPYRNIFQSGVLLMGMSYNIPVLVSDLAANREIITDGVNGLLFRSEDSNDLARRINYFFENKEYNQSLAYNAFAHVEENNNWELIAENYKRILNESCDYRIERVPVRI